MRGVKGKLLKKLKSIRPIGYLKPDRILQVTASDGFIDNFWSKSNVNLKSEEGVNHKNIVGDQETEIIDVSDLMKDLEDEEDTIEIEDKENVRPKLEKNQNPTESKENVLNLSEIDISSFRPPDLDSSTLFDPKLVAAFKQAVMEVKALEAERRARIEQEKMEEVEQEPPFKFRKIEENSNNPLSDFEEKCPPGGSDSVILYTTGLRGIRKTFEECSSIRFLLESFKVLYHERDVSMHSDFREELWRIMGTKIVPPRLFIKGRYIGGAEQVLTLHEQGKLRPLFDGLPIDESQGPCLGCAGFRFVLCFSCNGSRKIVSDEEEVSVESIICQDCNENGLIICPICC